MEEFYDFQIGRYEEEQRQWNLKVIRAQQAKWKEDFIKRPDEIQALWSQFDDEFVRKEILCYVMLPRIMIDQNPHRKTIKSKLKNCFLNNSTYVNDQMLEIKCLLRSLKEVFPSILIPLLSRPFVYCGETLSIKIHLYCKWFRDVVFHNPKASIEDGSSDTCQLFVFIVKTIFYTRNDEIRYTKCCRYHCYVRVRGGSGSNESYYIKMLDLDYYKTNRVIQWFTDHVVREGEWYFDDHPDKKLFTCKKICCIG